MTSYVFDSFAILAFFRREIGHEAIAEMLTDISAGKCNGSICAVNVGEVYYITSRKQGKDRAEIALNALLRLPLEVVPAEIELSLAAAEIKAIHVLSYAEAFAAALNEKEKRNARYRR
jgi:predicted nucleic acid-binding protein